MFDEIELIIKEIEIKIKNFNNIAIFISGGFDSTILSYLILDIVNKNNLKKNIEFHTVPRYDDSKNHAHRIVIWLLTKFETINSEIKIVGNPDLHHSKQVSSGIKECINDTESKIILLGDTKNPINLPNGPIRIKSNYENIFQPFFEYDKRITLNIAIHFGILHEISKITHTCTERKYLRCNHCWQCLERKWAFDSLSLKDVGEM